MARVGGKEAGGDDGGLGDGQRGPKKGKETRLRASSHRETKPLGKDQKRVSGSEANQKLKRKNEGRRKRFKGTGV